MRFVPVAFVAALVAAASGFGLACGSSNATTQSTSSTDDGGAESSVQPTDGGGGGQEAAPEAAPYPAFVPTDIPQVVTLGGPVMKSPKVVPIFFANDESATTSALADFVSKVGATQYWQAATSEYGVGALTGGTPVELTATDNPAATIDDSQIQTWLAGKLNANDPQFGTPDENTLYAIFYPAGVTVTQTFQSPFDAGTTVVKSCEAGGFGGYHASVALDAAHNNMDVAYAVLPRCTNDPLQPSATALQLATGTATHEFAEAATDPFYLSQTQNAAYGSVDANHRYWRSLLGGAEVGDMCAQDPGSFVTFPELAYTVQRIWSNKAALTGGDPCVPVPQGSVYFNTFPETPDTLDVLGRDGGVTGTTYKGVKIPVGQSKTIDLDLFSMAPTSGPWTVKAYDGNYLQTGVQSQAYLQFSFDKTQGQNGDKIKMTITVASAGQRNTKPYLLVSQLGSQWGLWAGVVWSN